MPNLANIDTSRVGAVGDMLLATLGSRLGGALASAGSGSMMAAVLDRFIDMFLWIWLEMLDAILFYVVSNTPALATAFVNTAIWRGRIVNLLDGFIDVGAVWNLAMVLISLEVAWWAMKKIVSGALTRNFFGIFLGLTALAAVIGGWLGWSLARPVLGREGEGAQLPSLLSLLQGGAR